MQVNQEITSFHDETLLFFLGGGAGDYQDTGADIGEGCALRRSWANALSAKCGAESVLLQIRWTFVCFEGSIVVKPQPAFLGPIYRSRSFWSWHVIFRFLLYTSWAHPQKFPSSCHNTCKSEVFMTLNTRGENCGLLCDSVIARQKKPPQKKLSACPGCFSLYTHICCERLLGLWKKNEKSFMDLVY